jgi:3-phenylpropionate/cinnamic acid dioxygenase small subunit
MEETMQRLTRLKRIMAVLLSTLVAGMLVFTASAFAKDKWAETTSFQKQIPGPEKFNMMLADNSGKVNTNIQFIADRQAIVNHVGAYAYLIDEGRWDEWYALFSDDVLFEGTVPGIGHIIANGKPGFQAFTDLRYRGPGSSKNTTVRRHTMGNVHVAEQTDTTAEVRTYMLISAAPASAPFKAVTTGTYNASLEKRDGVWTITRWAIEVDMAVKGSPAPKGLKEEIFKIIPDVRK